MDQKSIKPIKLGRLRYPITISKLLKHPGDSVKKGDSIFEYTFKYKKEVGDQVTGETWETEITSTASFASSFDGTLLKWDIRPGQVHVKDGNAGQVEETCGHHIQFAGMCAACGKDMTETSWAAHGVDADRAKINMTHDQTLLSVSQDEAMREGEKLQRRLLQNRKLSLVVDLDQTIIHACIEPTIGEWQADPTSPNHEAVKEVAKFQLDDGPRGLTNGCWYYIKMRPGLREFLAHVAEKYELHVYTMGTRAYAQQIAKIVDPEHKLFGDRIISRDENGSLTAKTLSRLFPVDTKMVVIIDDRADVWPRNRSNLIKVVPYDFFVGIGDINSSFLPKRQDIAQATPIVSVIPTANGKEADKKEAEDIKEQKVDLKMQVISTPDNAGSALDDLVSMGAGDETVRQIQAEEQAHFLEKQLVERPLLHLQQKLDAEEGAEEGAVNGTEESKSSPGETEHPHKHHNLLKDDDKELFYLERHLLKLHKTFFEQYDKNLLRAKGDRVSQLRPGHRQKVDVHGGPADLQLVPDIGTVMPFIKSNTLNGVNLVLSGLVPLGIEISRSEIGLQATAFGAKLHQRISRQVTHLVVSENRTRTQKVRQATKYPHIKVVKSQWLTECISRWEMVDEEPYLVNLHPDDRVKKQDLSDFSEMDRGTSGDESTDGDENAEVEDLDGDAPPDLADGESPIESLREVDWSSVDAELADFMGSDADDSSDEGSVTSNSSDRSNKEPSSASKRKYHTDSEEPSESEAESKLSKKQRLARSRTTGLKAVANSASEMPSEQDEGNPTDADDGDDTGLSQNGLDELEAEMEAEMMREFGLPDEGAAAVGGDGGDQV